MRPLRQEAVYCLMLEFPSTLKEWTEHVFGDVIDNSDSDVEGMFEILYLAYEHSITSILPALYLRICLTHNAVSRVVLFGSHIYLNSCLIASKKSLRAFNVLPKICLSITNC
jgi:hypothetical protein